MSKAAQYLLGKARTSILSVLLLHPERSLHVRELARLIRISPGSLHRELRALAGLGILARRETGRHVYYSANRQYPGYAELAGFLRKTAGVVDVLREALEPLSEQIRVAFVYGSVARGTEGPDSDVDVMVIGEAGFGEVVQVLENRDAILQREVNVSVMKPAELTRKARAGDSFVLNILKSPKLWILGNGDDLGELAEDRPPA